MSTTLNTKTAIPDGIDGRVLLRIVEEGYGPGAWHGADFKASLQDVGTELAFWRPTPARHNIAEIALHHAYCIRSVRTQLSGLKPEPFIVAGEDWFPLHDDSALSWKTIRGVLDGEQQRFRSDVTEIAAARMKPSLAERERFEIVLGITCHAIYHAGQIQLIKRLRGE